MKKFLKELLNPSNIPGLLYCIVTTAIFIYLENRAFELTPLWLVLFYGSLIAAIPIFEPSTPPDKPNDHDNTQGGD